MQHWIDEDQKAMAKRYLRSERHTMQVDYWRYIRLMKDARHPGGPLKNVPLVNRLPLVGSR
jgi:hypothetical protein